jgi:hypothetical protein
MKLFPENNAIFAVAATVGGKTIRFRVHQQMANVALLDEDEKGILGLTAIKKAVEDRLAPPADVRERVRGFVQAVRDGHESEMPHLEGYLLLGGLSLLAGEARSHLVGELRKLASGAKANDQLIAAFSKVSGETLLPEEAASLRALNDETNKADGLLPTLNFLEVLETRNRK